MTVIALLTDFGEADGYVAALKGIILGICPDVRFIDVSHQIRPRAIDQGAYVLGTVYPYLPAGTIYLGVVDPGVGTARRALAVAVPRAILVGPDNGLFSDVLAAHDGETGESLPEAPPEGPVPDGLGPVPAGCTAITLENRAFWRDEVSTTFHGRDIFAPVAAHLAAGVPLSDLGPRLDRVVRLAGIRPARSGQRWIGRVRHIDRFGNAISSIPATVLAAGRRCRIRVAGQTIEGLHRTYGEGVPGRPMVLTGSSGQLEVAIPGGSAAEQLGIELGAAVVVEPIEE